MQAAQGAFHEALDLGRGAQGVPPAPPLRGDLVRMHGVLGEPGAGAALVLLRIPPVGFQTRGVLVQSAEIEGELPGAATAQQHGVHQRTGHRAALLRQGDRHAKPGADGVRLAEDHLQHGAVDGAVRRIHQGGADEGCLLAEAVHPAFALLVPGGVPGQVVVDDGVEQALEVDAFGQAVGRYQQALRHGAILARGAHTVDLSAALVRRLIAGDRLRSARWGNSSRSLSRT